MDSGREITKRPKAISRLLAYVLIKTIKDCAIVANDGKGNMGAMIYMDSANVDLAKQMVLVIQNTLEIWIKKADGTQTKA